MISNASKLGTLLVAALFLTVACGGGGSSTRDGGVDVGDPVALANRAMSVISYSPGGDGFGYKATAVSGDFNQWATDNKDKIEDALNQVGSDYVLQVTGHTCTIGPRTPPGDGRLGNLRYSELRAQSVFNGLRRAGIPADQMRVKGVASDELLPGVDPKDQRQRRVTFQIVPK